MKLTPTLLLALAASAVADNNGNCFRGKCVLGGTNKGQKCGTGSCDEKRFTGRLCTYNWGLFPKANCPNKDGSYNET
ncbi:hypothetical protein F5Y04DRAFT_291472 [Hypomontagnella monticulosa]|nr:hypothetical protein F5Y04DRAFT_291472 [Hypomontagnella monticulosa]